MEMIRSMKKTSFMNKIREENHLKAFEKLQEVKESHSKVKEIEHNLIKIQKYLQPNIEFLTDYAPILKPYKNLIHLRRFFK